MARTEAAKAKAAESRRRARLAQGDADRAAEQAVSRSLPGQGQLLLPLLRSLDAIGGTGRPSEIYDRVAGAIGADSAVRAAEAVFADGKAHNLFERQVRHAQQLAKLKGLLETRTRGEWSLTDKGIGTLGNARRGLVLTVFETPNGLALWGHVEDAVKLIEPGSVDLIFTSPPFPILSGRAYGTWDPASWTSWMLDLIDLWKPLLAPGASVFVNGPGDAYERGRAYQSLSTERFVIGAVDRCGYRLAQRWHWDNPTKLGSIEWVSVRRRRLRQTIEPILWFVNAIDGIDDRADNRQVLQPYKADTRTRYIGRDRRSEATIRPSGIDIGADAFARDNGGAIPSTLISLANAASNNQYRRACRAAGLPLHPATFPDRLPDRAVLMTTQPGDLVFEPFLGSGTTAAAAERLGRRWIGVDRSRAYLEGARLRFGGAATTPD